MMTHRHIGICIAVAGVSCLLLGCGDGKPKTEAEKLARGRELVEAMSARLASATALTVSTREVRDVIRESGEKETLSFTDAITVRRPDRFHAKATGEKRTVEAWYDGKNVILAVHSDKVFAQAPMPETIDRTLDAVAERYGFVLPVADLFYSSAAKALLTDTTRGGYAGREAIEGVDCYHLAFQDTGVDWEIWFPVEGDPLPRRLKATQKERQGKPVADVIFTAWNLNASAPDATFTPVLPADYEGIAMLQRGAAVRAAAKKAPAAKIP